jgi:hypothetical protein
VRQFCYETQDVAECIDAENLIEATCIANGVCMQGPVATHCILVDEHGDAYAFGRNDNGQLGLGDKSQRNGPTLIPSMWGGEAIEQQQDGLKLHDLAHAEVCCTISRN